MRKSRTPYLPALIVLLAATATAATGSKVFSNGDFEMYEGGRPVGWTLGQRMTAGRGLGHNGNGGIMWSSETPQAERLCSAQQRFSGFAPGSFFKFSLFVKKEGFKRGEGDGFAAVIEWLDKDGKWICAPAARGKDVPGEWQLYGGGGVVPENAVTGNLHIYVCRGARGRVSVDNVQVECLKRDPVQFVCSSAYRDIVTEGPVSFHAVLFTRAEAKCCESWFRWTGADGTVQRKRADTHEMKANQGEASITIDAKALVPGQSPVFCELWANGSKLGEASVVMDRTGEKPKRRVWIDEHKRCIVDGKPFFPLGMYWGRTNDETLGIYTNGAFNCVMPYAEMTIGTLDRLQRAGLMGFSCVNRLSIGKERLLQLIETQKKHPALLGWYVMDEAGVERVAELTDWYRFIREHDADHPTYAVQDRIYDLRNFMPAADVFGLDPYPVAEHALRRVTEFTRGGEKALFGVRPFWNVPQTFAWRWYRPGTGEKGRFPTLDEIRSMCWQHIAGGANGLVAFCFYRLIEVAKEPDVRVRKDNFSRVSAVSHEIARLFPVLLSVDDCPSLTYSRENLACRTWMKDGALYILTCNLTGRLLEADIEIGEGRWQMAGCEIGTPATMVSERMLRVGLAADGVSFVRLTRR